MSQALRFAYLFVLFTGVALTVQDESRAQATVTEPGGDSASAKQAQDNADEYAWRLFEFINLQGTSAAGVPSSKAITSYDDDTSTVWEAWALASGDGGSQDGSEVYKPDGSDPAQWTDLLRSSHVQKKVFSINLKVAAAKSKTIGHNEHISSLKSTSSQLNVKPLVAGPNPAGGFEVRVNRAAFDFVRDNELYNIEGLAAKYAAAKAAGNRDLIQFPPMAKEVKADWVATNDPKKISADEKTRYHWRKVGDKYFKLTGFHVTTKDLKQWFWADFAQEDFETSPGPALPSRDSTTRGSAAPDRGSKDGERKELIGSKWAHYRLRGTQIDFLDAAGKPIIVGNTMIESGRADKSSCMTCHFNATMADVSSDGSLDSLSGGTFFVGKPDAAALGEGNTIKYLQNDFEWSSPFRAQHKIAKP